MENTWGTFYYWKIIYLITMVNLTVVEIFYLDFPTPSYKIPSFVNPSVVEIFYKIFPHRHTKVLVLVNPTVVEIFYQDFPTPSYKSPGLGKSYNSLIQSQWQSRWTYNSYSKICHFWSTTFSREALDSVEPLTWFLSYCCFSLFQNIYLSIYLIFLG